MPVDVDRFEDGENRTQTTSERVVRFLATNDDRAYTRSEVAEAIDADPETVGTDLTRLILPGGAILFSAIATAVGLSTGLVTFLVGGVGGLMIAVLVLGYRRAGDGYRTG